jgi:nucleoside diphosphate kinase
MILEREDCIRKWRQLIGPTRPIDARLKSPNSLRALFGISDTRNSFHGSGKQHCLK